MQFFRKIYKFKQNYKKALHFASQFAVFFMINYLLFVYL